MIRDQVSAQEWGDYQRLEARMLARVDQVVVSPEEHDLAGPFRETEVREVLRAQSADAKLAGQLMESTGHDEHAAAMSAYAAGLDEATEPGRETLHWRPVVEGLQSRLDPEQLDELAERNEMKLARGASLEAALLSWSPSEPPARSRANAQAYQRAAAAYKQEATVMEISGEPVEFDKASPVRDAVRQTMTEQQNTRHWVEMTRWKTRISQGDVTAMDDPQARAWYAHGTPVLAEMEPGPVIPRRVMEPSVEVQRLVDQGLSSGLGRSPDEVTGPA